MATSEASQDTVAAPISERPPLSEPTLALDGFQGDIADVQPGEAPQGPAKPTLAELLSRPDKKDLEEMDVDDVAARIATLEAYIGLDTIARSQILRTLKRRSSEEEHRESYLETIEYRGNPDGLAVKKKYEKLVDSLMYAEWLCSKISTILSKEKKVQEAKVLSTEGRDYLSRACAIQELYVSKWHRFLDIFLTGLVCLAFIVFWLSDAIHMFAKDSALGPYSGWWMGVSAAVFVVLFLVYKAKLTVEEKSYHRRYQDN